MAESRQAASNSHRRSLNRRRSRRSEHIQSPATRSCGGSCSRSSSNSMSVSRFVHSSIRLTQPAASSWTQHTTTSTRRVGDGDAERKVAWYARTGASREPSTHVACALCTYWVPATDRMCWCSYSSKSLVLFSCARGSCALHCTRRDCRWRAIAPTRSSSGVSRVRNATYDWGPQPLLK